MKEYDYTSPVLGFGSGLSPVDVEQGGRLFSTNMSYSHSVDAMNGEMPIKEKWYKCDITGELIWEGWPHFAISEKDVHISYDAIRFYLMPLFVKFAPVPFEWVVADMKARAGLLKDRRPNLPAKIRRQVIAEEGGTCRKCGATDRLQVDHIVPVSKGGEDDRVNLQVLCQPCNGRKHTKDNDAFMAK